MAEEIQKFESFEFEEPGEDCGVFGVYAPGLDVVRLAYGALPKLQHRGQEGAGISASDGEALRIYKDTGLVRDVFGPNGTHLSGLSENYPIIATGQVRYGTANTGKEDEHAALQPLFFEGNEFGDFSFTLSMNGHVEGLNHNLVSDSFEMKERIGAEYIRTGDLTKALKECLPKFEGAYCLVLSTPNEMVVARDPKGFRPLWLGRIDNEGWIAASEVAAITGIGGKSVREVEPGEIISIRGADEKDVFCEKFAEVRRPSLCGFEFVYFSRPDNVMFGENVSQVRYRMGIALAERDNEANLDANIVVPIPESATTASQGYGWTRHIPVVEGLVKNRYIGRTFIGSTQEERIQAVRDKFNVNTELIRGRDIVLIDDSIVRGTTTKIIIQMLREAGVGKIHLRISSPPYKWPCFYGMDTNNQDKLLAANLTIEEMREYLGADSLDFISTGEMEIAVGKAAGKLCTACTTGNYPVSVPIKLGGNLGVLLDSGTKG